MRFGRDGWHALPDALANLGGDQLLAVEETAVERARAKERATAERERRRPARTRCGAKFTDEQDRADTWDADRLCVGCRQADADQQRSSPHF